MKKGRGRTRKRERRAGRSKASRRTAPGPRKATRPRKSKKSLPAKIRAKSSAVREVGEKHVRRVPLEIGETAWLTPTGPIRGHYRGFGAVREAMEAIRDQLPGETALFTFTLVVTFNGPDGRDRREYPHIGIPVDIKGPDALTNKVLSIIHDTIFREIIPAVFGNYPNAKTVDNRETAEEMLRDIKEQRGIRFKCRFYREVIHREAAKETPRRLRGRFGGRFPRKPVPIRARRGAPNVGRRNPSKRARQVARPGRRSKKKGESR